MAKQIQKNNKSTPGEERFLATGKNVTLLKSGGKNSLKKKTGTSKGGK